MSAKFCKSFYRSQDSSKASYECTPLEYFEILSLYRKNKYNDECYKNGRLDGTMEGVKLLNWTNNRQTLFEWLDGSQQYKPYFDIDLKINKKIKKSKIEEYNVKMIEKAKWSLINVFGKYGIKPVFAIETCSGHEKPSNKDGILWDEPTYTKISIHIVITNFKIQGFFLHSLLSDTGLFKPDKDGFEFDSAVYNSNNQKFRVAGFNKKSSIRQSSLVEGELSDFLVSVDCDKLPAIGNILETHPSKIRSPVKISVEKNKVCKSTKFTNPTWADKLMKIPNDLPYVDWMRISMAVKNIGEQYKPIWLKWCGDKYSKSKNEEQWNGFRKVKNGVGEGTIIHYYKHHNGDNEDIYDYLENPNQHDASLLFIKAYNNKIRCTDRESKTGEFYIYDEKERLWRRCNNDSFIGTIATTLTNPIEDILLQALNKKNICETPPSHIEYGTKAHRDVVRDLNKNDEDYKDCVKWIKVLRGALVSLKTATYCKAIISFLKSNDDIYESNFNDKITANPHLLSVENGVIDLTTGIIRKREYNDYLVNYLKIKYDPEADSSAFHSFMTELFTNEYYKDVTGVVSFIQKLLGYTITKEVREQIMCLFHGNGRNGKSVLCNIIKDIFDENVVKVKDTLFDKKMMKNNANNASPEIAKLFNKSVAICNETEEDLEFGAVFKDFVDGGRHEGRELYKDIIDFKNTTKLIMNLNKIVHLPYDDEAVLRRIIVISFLNKYEPKVGGVQKKGTLPIDVFKESTLLKNRSGILKWFVDGAIRYYSEGGIKDIPDELEKSKREAVYSCDWTQKLEFTGDKNDKMTIPDVHQHIMIMTGKKIKTKDIERVMVERGAKTGRRAFRYYSGVKSVALGCEDSDSDDDEAGPQCLIDL